MRARTSVNYAENVTKEAEHAGAESRSRTSSLLPNENVCGGPTARCLLGLLGMLPKEKDSVEDDENEVELMEGEENEDDPFFAPKWQLIFDQLGRKHRYLSPASIQASIVRSIEGTGTSVITPSCLLDEEDAMEEYLTVLVCTTGDKVVDLPQFEPASFARCRFAPRTFSALDEEEQDDSDKKAENQGEPNSSTLAQIEAQTRRKVERRLARRARAQKKMVELERNYRTRKSYELWRFRCIHGDGCTNFPMWSMRSHEVLKGLGNECVDTAFLVIVATQDNVADNLAPSSSTPATALAQRSVFEKWKALDGRAMP